MTHQSPFPALPLAANWDGLFLLRIDLLEIRHDLLQRSRQPLHGGLAQVPWDPVVRLSDAAGNGRDRIAVAANRNSIADRILESREEKNATSACGTDFWQAELNAYVGRISSSVKSSR